VHRFAWVILRSEADAEEVAQECFLTLAQRAASFRPERAQLRTWLLGITRNLCYRRGRHRIQEDAEAAEPAEAPEIEAAMIRNQTADAVRKR